MKIYRGKVPLYGWKLKLVTASDIRPWIPKKLRAKGDKRCKAITISNPKRNKIAILFRTPIKKRNRSIAHEADHASHQVLRHVGVVECDESEEAFTYLTDWFVHWLDKRLTTQALR